mgnify:CR=1 FL=1
MKHIMVLHKLATPVLRKINIKNTIKSITKNIVKNVKCAEIVQNNIFLIKKYKLTRINNQIK